jgi:hypothetical protein
MDLEKGFREVPGILETMSVGLTAVSFGSFPLDLLGKADTFVQLRPEHVLEGYGPVLTRYQAPQVATPVEAKREGSWESRYGMEWWPVGPCRITALDLTTSLREAVRRIREEGPRQVEVTPEFVREILLVGAA